MCVKLQAMIIVIFNNRKRMNECLLAMIQKLIKLLLVRLSDNTQLRICSAD